MTEAGTPSKINVPRRFAVFVVCILVITAISTYATTYYLLNNAFDEVQSEYTAEAFLQIENDFSRLVETHITALADEAERSIYTNTVMHALDNTAPLKDYLEKQVLLGQSVRLALLNIDGETIETTFPQRDSFAEQGWVTSLIEGETEAHAGIYSKNSSTDISLLLSVPVVYRGHPEGVLVAEISLGPVQLEKALDHSLDSISLRFLSIGAQEVGRVGVDAGPDAAVSSFLLPYSDTIVQHSLELQSVEGTLSDLLGINMLITLVLAGLFLIIFQIIGTRVFIKPQQLLADAQRATLRTNHLLEVANEELSQFAYRSSHDLRSPLITVKGLVEFSQHDLQSGKLDEVGTNLEKIGRHVEKLDVLVGAILDLSRADFDDSDESPIDLDAICAEIQARLVDDSELVGFKIEVTNKLDRTFFSQQARVMQILENLISNAIKYADPEKPQQYVKVTLSGQGANTLLVVEDNGLGIPVDKNAEVFSMFKRFHPTLAVGSGLGLSIVKKHVDRLEGEIYFTSSEEGTKFTLTFPPAIGAATPS